MPVATRIVRHFGLQASTAVHVLELVPGSPAARAGVEVGDRMVAINGVPIDGIDGLQRLLDSDWIDRDAQLELLRRSTLLKVALRPVEMPAQSA